MSDSPITVRVEYFAQLREASGKSGEQVRVRAAGLADLYQQLQRQYAFPLAVSSLRVAVNHAIADWNAPLRDGDTVTFLPPVAGG